MTTTTKTLTKNQQMFVRAAKRNGLEIDYGYSGRGMYGATCPAVRVSRASDIPTRAKVSVDGMGLGVVVYAQS